jgi:hypothetical protein
LRAAVAASLVVAAIAPAPAAAQIRQVGPEYVATVKGSAELNFAVQDSIHEQTMRARLSWRTRIYEIYVSRGRLVNPTWGESPVVSTMDTTWTEDGRTRTCSGTARRSGEISRLRGRRRVTLRPFETAGGFIRCDNGLNDEFCFFARGGGYDASFELPRLRGRRRAVVRLQSEPDMPIDRCLGGDPRRDDPTAQATCTLTWRATITFRKR